jgi:hypothetical protein
MHLNILNQPGSPTDGIEFYKDEGGKGNWMSLKVNLKGNNKTTTDNSTLELRTTLYFESGLPVESTDQKILLVRLQGTKPTTTSTSKTDVKTELKKETGGDTNTTDSHRMTLKKSTLKTGVTIEFRIQKVSRRKDNQRFTVQLSVTDSTTIVPIFTRPITVLSKRKIPARLRNDPEAIALYKAEKLHRAQNNRAAANGKRSRSRSSETTPELRPHLAGSKLNTNNGPSKKRARGSTTSSKQAYTGIELRGKIDQMSHTINQLYGMMQDQRIQIDSLQEQVRVLNDSNMHLGFAALDGAFEDDVSVVGQKELHTTTTNGAFPSPGPSPRHQRRSTMLSSSSSMLTGLEMLSASSDDISTTFDDSTEKCMVKDMKIKEPLTWHFNHQIIDMPPLPVLNL